MDGQHAVVILEAACKMIFYDKDGDFNYAVRKRDLSEAHRVSDIELD